MANLTQGWIATISIGGPADLENVIKIQDGYKAEPLSTFLGESGPPPAPVIAWPVYDKASAEGLGFFAYLTFLHQFAPELPEDQPVRDLLARIGVAPGHPFDASALSPEIQAALQAGIDTANTGMNLQIGAIPNANELFGSRDFLKGHYLDRAVGARYGIYGNAVQEAMYLGYRTNALGQPLTGSGPGYTLTFAKGDLPSVHAFWSLTIYDGKTQLLVANPINRYLNNSPMLPQLTKDADGNVTLYLQHESPGAAREANWLPLPDGPFYGVLRLYWPDETALSGAWQQPALQPQG